MNLFKGIRLLKKNKIIEIHNYLKKTKKNVLIKYDD